MVHVGTKAIQYCYIIRIDGQVKHQTGQSFSQGEKKLTSDPNITAT